MRFWSCVKLGSSTDTPASHANFSKSSVSVTDEHICKDCSNQNKYLVDRNDKTQNSYEKNKDFKNISKNLSDKNIDMNISKSKYRTRLNLKKLPKCNNIEGKHKNVDKNYTYHKKRTKNLFFQNLTPRHVYILVAFLACIIYFNSVFGDAVHDDLSAVSHNPDVQGTSSIVQLFLNDFWGKPMSHPASHKSYRPITILTFR